MKKKKKISLKKILKLIIIFLILVIIALFIYVKFIRNNNNKEDLLIGTWTTDGVTVYEFNDDNTGKLIVPLGTYDFDYKIEDDSLFIDFKNKKSTDTKYTYSFEKNKLVLEGTNGKFVFKKK